MKASDWIIDFLSSHGVDTAFGYIGGMVTYLIDSAAKDPRLRFIQTYHEQSAAFAAEGYARLRGGVGVAIATSGPGATNMLTGVADAYFDSIPILFITGQVNSSEYKYNKPIRQQGFQETDIVSMASPVTKYAVMVDDPKRIVYEFEKAFYIATTGRPGPVLIDLPMNLQAAELFLEDCVHFTPEPESSGSVAGSAAAAIVAAINAAARPLLLVGGGCHHPELRGHLNRLISSGIPAVVSLMGKGSVDETEPLFTGMLGCYGNRCANLSVARSDLLVVLGSRLDTRQTGARLDDFAVSRRIIQVDIDIEEMRNHRLRNRETILLDVVPLLAELEALIPEIRVSASWKNEIVRLKRNYSTEREVERFVTSRVPYGTLAELSRLAADNTIYFADVGQNQMWAAQTLAPRGDQDFFTSGGMAPMGYAIPAGIGAALATGGKRPVIVITGDGGLQIALQSLPLISQYDLPVTVVVMNNESLGMITQFQQIYLESNFVATTPAGGYRGPRCRELAAAFGLDYRRVEAAADVENVFVSRSRHTLIEVITGFPSVVSPKLEFNKPFYEMSPPLPREELARVLEGRA